jgi:hypothetical protein
MPSLRHASTPSKHSANKAPQRRGPRTAAGKASSARNALRHGLSVPVLADPATAAAVEALACQVMAELGRTIHSAKGIEPAGEGSDRLPPRADLGTLARAVAEAQVDLLRIRRVRHELIAAGLTGENGPAQLGARLAAIERYERCALARRRRAIRAGDAERRVRPHADEVP